MIAMEDPTKKKILYKDIDLNDYVTVEQALDLAKIGYPRANSEYYWHWTQLSLTEDEKWEFLPADVVKGKHSGQLMRCIAAPTKEEAVIWKLKTPFRKGYEMDGGGHG